MRAMLPSLFVAVVSIVCVRPFLTASAADFRQADAFVVKSDETIEDDLYVCARSITIDGTVDGDLIGWAQEITINGTVKGSLIVGGQTVVLNGEAYNARIAAQVIKLGPKAKLDGDLLAGGQSLECAKESNVGGDVIFGGYQALLAGQIGDEVRAALANCRLEGSVGGDVHLQVGGDKNAQPINFGPPPPVAMPSVPGGLSIADSATIEGDLTYQAKRAATIDPQATVNGETTFSQEQPAAKHGRPAAAAWPSIFTKALGRVKHLVCVALVGLAVLLLFPRWSTAWADTIRTRPGASFMGGLLGLGAFIAFLVVTVVVIAVAAIFLAGVRLTELVPMVVVGGMVGYAAVIVGFWILAAFLAEALAGLAVGRLALRDDAAGVRLGALVLGLLLVGVVLSVPYLGGLIGFVIFIFGIGSICLWLIGQTPAAPSFGPPASNKPMPATVL